MVAAGRPLPANRRFTIRRIIVERSSPDWDRVVITAAHTLSSPTIVALSCCRAELATSVSGGSTGNGARKQHREKYLPNSTTLNIFSLFEKPEEKKAG